MNSEKNNNMGLKHTLTNKEVEKELNKLDFQKISEAGHWIKDMRLKHNLTQKELGKLTGMYQQQIAQYEKGLRNPKTSTLMKIATSLGEDLLVSLDDWGILPGEDVNDLIINDGLGIELSEILSRLNKAGIEKVLAYAKDILKIPAYCNNENP